jgi:hypothetical protein
MTVEVFTIQTKESPMASVILISTVAIIVAIVGCAVIWRLDASRADEIEHLRPAPVPRPSSGLAPSPHVPRALGE